MGFSDLKARYSTSETVVVGDIPLGSASVVCRTAFGAIYVAVLDGTSAVFSTLPAGTHAVEAWTHEGELVSEEYTTVSQGPGEHPVMAFATSFGREGVERVLSSLRSALHRCAVLRLDAAILRPVARRRRLHRSARAASSPGCTRALGLRSARNGRCGPGLRPGMRG